MSNFNVFDKAIIDIENAYHEFDYKLGWRFLNCSKTVLLNNPQIVLITLNPGGNAIPDDHAWGSCENGNSYIYEKWGNFEVGKHPLQIQVQLMFKTIAQYIGFENPVADLIEQSLCGYFIPFRSSRLKNLPHQKQAFKFAYHLWKNVLKNIFPSWFICIDRNTYRNLIKLIPLIYNLPLSYHRIMPTGWGNCKADIVYFDIPAKIRLLRLPHLSTFKLFTSKKCSSNIDQIFDLLCR